ncbi:cytochrome P450 monooxygenase-like protein [Xylogone sp. PMI_703]|nr:cytochrome P450 monooxygenase-like protein [Xylogone sp. PMI_703]
MTMLPFKAITALAAVSSYVLVAHKPDVLLFSKPSYIGTFLQLWTVQLLGYAFWKVILWPKIFSPLRGLPEPTGNSWWNGQYARISAEPTGVPMTDWVNSIPNDGVIRYLGLFNSERVLVTSPKAMSEVLTTRSYEFIKPAQVQRGLSRILGVGVLLAEGDEHKTQRKNLMPAFAFRHIKDLYPVFWELSREAVRAMTNDIGTENKETASEDVEKSAAATSNEQAIFEAGSWASRATLDIIGVAGMGQKFGAIHDPHTPLNETYRKVFKPSRQAQVLALLNLFLPSWFVRNLPAKRNGEVEEAAAVIKSTCRQLIREKKAKLEKHQLTDVDILSVALESGGFTEENLVDQMMTFLAAGHETTASSMIWAVYALCVHPEMQTRLREEIRARLPSVDEDTQVTNLEIDHMPYLNAVCSEVLRYFTPVPLTLREAAHDTTIAGNRIPKGTRIVIVPSATNKDEALWGSDARIFKPDRWLSKDGQTYIANGGASSNYAFMTFLHGPRSCIGQAFAKAEFACLLAAWIGRFEFELKNKEEMDERNLLIKGGVTSKPAKGLWVKTRVVEGW